MAAAPRTARQGSIIWQGNTQVADFPRDNMKFCSARSDCAGFQVYIKPSSTAKEVYIEYKRNCAVMPQMACDSPFGQRGGGVWYTMLSSTRCHDVQPDRRRRGGSSVVTLDWDTHSGRHHDDDDDDHRHTREPRQRRERTPREPRTPREHVPRERPEREHPHRVHVEHVHARPAREHHERTPRVRRNHTHHPMEHHERIRRNHTHHARVHHEHHRRNHTHHARVHHEHHRRNHTHVHRSRAHRNRTHHHRVRASRDEIDPAEVCASEDRRICGRLADSDPSEIEEACTTHARTPRVCPHVCGLCSAFDAHGSFAGDVPTAMHAQWRTALDHLAGSPTARRAVAACAGALVGLNALVLGWRAASRAPSRYFGCGDYRRKRVPGAAVPMVG